MTSQLQTAFGDVFRLLKAILVMPGLLSSTDEEFHAQTPTIQPSLFTKLFAPFRKIKSSLPGGAALTSEQQATADGILQLLKSYSPPGDVNNSIRRIHVETSINGIVKSGGLLHLTLPAFPFKSPNSIDKVLGTLPDIGEEIALARLEGLCADLERKFCKTQLSIVSDGLVYNDLLGVKDETVWKYGSALRELARRKFPHISFVRLNQLVSTGTEEAKTLDEYLATAGMYRDQLVASHTPAGFDVKTHLEQDPSALMTYRGYIKFLETDLAYAEGREGLSKKGRKKLNEIVAKKMIVRGTAFSNAVSSAFPNAVRLSIHPSLNKKKLPISLFPGSNNNFVTPWHTASVIEMNGTIRLAHRSTLSADPKYELVTRRGLPSHFQEASPLYHWAGCQIDVTPLYPAGLVISPQDGPDAVSIEKVDMMKVKALAELNSPVVLRGFSSTPSPESPTTRELFMKKGREMGPILPWKFGEVLVVKDGGDATGGLNNVLSSEPMPFHFDGLFKTIQVSDRDGSDKLVPQPPQFQVFRAATPSPPHTGFTMISPSRLVFENLPSPYTVEQLSGLTWSCRTTAFNATALAKLDLVVPHPTRGTPCLRYHEPWGHDKTRFDPTIVEIENGPQEILTVLDELLYDRRVCYYHSWQEGDWLVNDNVATMHTRSDFASGSSRELWRLHID
ncbi:hypothetical protein BUE80_DR012495 [Diplocarpon rosae]|nr:hypothetical protein BUE80_DR012495 [Diplocarpon rosae]